MSAPAISMWRNDMTYRGPTLEVRWKDHTPHWQVATSAGYASAQFSASPKWLSIDATEAAAKSSKRVMLTLDRPAMQALHALLGEVLPDRVATLEAALRAAEYRLSAMSGDGVPEVLEKIRSALEVEP